MNDMNLADAAEPDVAPPDLTEEEQQAGHAGASNPDQVSLAPEPPRESRIAAVREAVNPLLEAAQPLLRVLCDLPESIDEFQVEVLRRLLEHEVSTFQSVCASAQIRHEHVLAASYSLCTAIDEAVQNRPWGGGVDHQTGIWASKSLAQKFHEDSHGGEKIFLLIGRLAATPQEHLDLLELLFFVIALGFEGRYRRDPQGRRQLETIQHRLLEIVMRGRGEVPRALSPSWKGEDKGRFRLLHGVPVWATATLLALALLAQFGWFKYQLAKRSMAIESEILSLGGLRPPEAAKPLHRSLRLKELLAPEIARGSVSVEEDERQSVVSFKGDDMFIPGQARVSPAQLATITKVADQINDVSGIVRVTGHSDDRPIRTRQYPDNQALSEARAAAVADVLRSHGVAPERVLVEGRGDTQPVADNRTPAGRARNRRVDIAVTQGEAFRAPGSAR